MLHIVTGAVNAGKTTRMKALYSRCGGVADGLVSEKLYENGAFHGYRLVHLQSGESAVLALLEQAYHGQFQIACGLGPFVFSAEAFRFGAQMLRWLCADPVICTLFLDEAGPLELRGQGFADVLPALLHSGKNSYIAVRSGCVRGFLDKFEIADYRLIAVGNTSTVQERQL